MMESGSAMYLINQGNSLNGLADFEVERLVRQQLPKGSYTSISVSSVQENIAGQGDIKGRKITSQRQWWSQIPEIFIAFFSELFNPTYAEARYANTGGALMAALIAQDGRLDDASRQQAEDEIKAAFHKCRVFSIFISDDCNYTKLIDGEDSEALVVIRGAAKAVRAFFEMLKTKYENCTIS